MERTARARVFQGTLPGTLATEPRGTSGFGYDAIFIPHDHANGLPCGRA